MAGTLIKLACVLLLCMVVADATMTCDQITGGMAPCLGYLSNGGIPVKKCCDNLRSMVNSAKTTADRRNICNCLKSAATKTKLPINAGNAAKLPSACKVRIPYTISKATNCNSVK